MRNLAHIIIGWAIAVSATQFGDLQLVGHIAIGSALAFLFGLAWEVGQEHYNRKFDFASRFDWEDVLRTAVGGILGGLYQHFADSQWWNLPAYIILAGAILYVVERVKTKRAM